MSRQSLQRAIDIYQAARLSFVRTLHSFASKDRTRLMLKDFNLDLLLQPLLKDADPKVQQVTLATLCKLMSSDADMRTEMAEQDLLNTMLHDLNRLDAKTKRTTLRMLTCAAQSRECADLIGHDELTDIATCLQDKEPETRACAATALGTLLRHSSHLAASLQALGTFASFIELLEHSNLHCQQAGAYALGNVAIHGERLAQEVADVIPLLVEALQTALAEHTRLKVNVLYCLANVAQHSPQLATHVATSGALEAAIKHLASKRAIVQKHAATLVFNIAQWNSSEEISKVIVSKQGLQNLVHLIACGYGDSVLLGVKSLGMMASMSAGTARRIIRRDAVQPLMRMVTRPHDEELQAAAVWTLGQLSKHSAHHVKAMTSARVFQTVVQKMNDPEASVELKTTCRTVVGLILPNYEDERQLETFFLSNPPEELEEPILSAFGRVLRKYPESRASFVKSGCLRKMQQMQEDKEETQKSIRAIQKLFPPELIQIHSPDLMEHLVLKLDSFVPKDIVCKDMPAMTSVTSVDLVPRLEQ